MARGGAARRRGCGKACESAGERERVMEGKGRVRESTAKRPRGKWKMRGELGECFWGIAEVAGERRGAEG